MSRFEERLTPRPGKRETNWFLRGWEYRDGPDGKGGAKRRLVYTGEYYRLCIPAQKRPRVKALAAALWLAVAGVYLGFETTLTQGGLAWYAGAPCLLALLPLFYLTLGVWNFCRAEAYFTFRRCYAAYTRLRVGGRLAALLLGLGALGQTVFVARYGRLLRLGPELFLLFGALFCALGAGALALLARKVPCEEVSRKEFPGENRGI